MDRTTPGATRRDLFSLIGAAAGGAALYQAMTELGHAAESPYRGPIKLEGAPKGASVLILGAGLAGMTLPAARDLARHGIRVLSIAPGLVATSVFSFITAWNEFLFAFVLTGMESRTLPVALVGLIIAHVYFAVRPEKWWITKAMLLGWITRREYLEHHDPARWVVPSGSASRTQGPQ